MCNNTDAREHRNKGVMARALGKKTGVRLQGNKYMDKSTGERAQGQKHSGKVIGAMRHRKRYRGKGTGVKCTGARVQRQS